MYGLFFWNRVLEQTDSTKSIEMYDESCKLYEEENKMRFGVDVFKRAIGVCVRNNRYGPPPLLPSILSHHTQ